MSDKEDEKLSENEEEEAGQVRILLSDDDKPVKVGITKVSFDVQPVPDHVRIVYHFRTLMKELMILQKAIKRR